MKHLEEMEIFVRVVEHGSISAAAGALHISPSKVSVYVARLEKRLRVTLLDRTSRTLTLTDVGLTYLAHCQHILSEIAETNSRLLSASQTPSGVLRIDAAVAFINEMLLPVLPLFFGRFPDISLELSHSMHLMDLGHQTCDVLIRVGPVEDSNLIGVPLGHSKVVTVAAPSYLAKHGEPRIPQELHEHNCLQFSDPNSGRIEEWHFQKDGQRLDIRTQGNLTFNEGESRVAAAVRGHGLYQGVEFLLHRWIKLGALKVVLNDWEFQTRPIVMAYARSKQPPAKLRAFIDFMREMYPAQAEIVAVFADAGADPDAEVHRVLVEKLFSNRRPLPPLRSGSALLDKDRSEKIKKPLGKSCLTSRGKVTL